MLNQAFRPTAYDLKFRVLGVDARVHPTFWLGGLIFAGDNATLVEILTGTAVLFVSIFVHEMGHALCGKHYRDRVPSIMLHGMGGHYSPGNIIRYGQKIWMLIWGPLAGFILGAIAVGAFFAMRARLIPFSPILASIIWDAMWINVIWGVMNLLPVYPLDGGQILLEVIRWKYPLKDDALAFLISMITAAVACACGIAGVFLIHLSLFTPLFFGVLIYLNYKMRQMDIQTGGAMRYEAEERREPWERDGDWWKNGGRDDSDWWKKN